MSDVADELAEICIIFLEKLKELRFKGLLSDKEYKECIELKIRFLQSFGYNTSQWDETTNSMV